MQGRFNCAVFHTQLLAEGVDRNLIVNWDSKKVPWVMRQALAITDSETRPCFLKMVEQSQQPCAFISHVKADA